MGKLTMCFLIAAAFVYAVWLVAARKRPGMRRDGAGWRAFLMLVLFFMGWLGAPVRAAEAGQAGAGVETTTELAHNADLAAALRSAWEALGVISEYRQMKPDEAAALRQAAASHPETLKAAVKKGSISLGAADVLQFAYMDMRAHLERQLATCYMAMPPIAAPREDMEARLVFLARAADQDIEPSALEEIETALAADIVEIHLLRVSEKRHSQIMEPGREERRNRVLELQAARKRGDIDDAAFRAGLMEVAREARRQLLAAYFKLPDACKEADLREAVGILVAIARDLPDEWRQSRWR